MVYDPCQVSVSMHALASGARPQLLKQLSLYIFGLVPER